MSKNQSSLELSPTSCKKGYSAPRLAVYGSVVSITKGADPTGTQDGMSVNFTMV